MSSLFCFFEEGKDYTNTVTWISIVSAVVLLLIIFALSFKQKKPDAKSIAFAGICIALSFGLSFIKIPTGLFGGSITLASLLPLVIYAYAFGVIKGLMAGLIYGLLQFIQEPYLLTPLSFVLDYVLAFSGIALVGVFKLIFKHKQKTAILTGCAAAYVWRFVMHLLSGLIYFSAGIIVEGLPLSNAWLYSFVYQCTYLPFDFILCFIVLFILVVTPAFSKLLTHLNPPNNKDENSVINKTTI